MFGEYTNRLPPLLRGRRLGTYDAGAYSTRSVKREWTDEPRHTSVDHAKRASIIFRARRSDTDSHTRPLRHWEIRLEARHHERAPTPRRGTQALPRPGRSE